MFELAPCHHECNKRESNDIDSKATLFYFMSYKIFIKKMRTVGRKKV